MRQAVEGHDNIAPYGHRRGGIRMLSGGWPVMPRLQTERQDFSRRSFKPR